MLIRKILILLLAVVSFSSAVADNSGPGEKTVKWGMAARFRFVSWDNAIFLDNSREAANTFTRHRTSFWFDWKPLDHLRCYLKFTNEFRYYFQPEKKFSLHEFFPDNLYLQLNCSPILPLTITAGRQNIILGEGFVMMDPNPLDGSRSIYFNGIRMDGTLAEGHTVTMFYVKQPVVDDWIPSLNPQDQLMIEQPEEGMGIYYRGKGLKMNWETYLIFKNKLKTDQYPPSSLIRTLGGRCIIPLSRNLHVTLEAALQKGEQDNHDISAWGGYTHVDYNLEKTIPFMSKLTLGAVALSGDDPGTSDVEGWDPLFSRWPKWSESYIYTLIPETEGRVAYWSNLFSMNTSFEFRIIKKTKLKLTYHYLGSFHDLAHISSRQYGQGKVRGDLFIVRSTYQINKFFKGHVVFERFIPGSFYSDKADLYNWFRYELVFTL